MAEDEQDTPELIVSALRDLVQTHGWTLLKAQATREWGPQGYGERMAEAISKVPNGPDRAWELARVAEQTDATARAIRALIDWPNQEIRRLAVTKKTSRWQEGIRGMVSR